MFKSSQSHHLVERYIPQDGGVKCGGQVVQEEELKKCVILEKHCLEVHASRQAFVGHCYGRRKLKGRSGRK